MNSQQHKINTQEYRINTVPEKSNWNCYLFGSDGKNGLSWRPLKGKEPNWFWRLMQYLIFGNKWVKDKDNVQHSTNT